MTREEEKEEFLHEVDRRCPVPKTSSTPPRSRSTFAESENPGAVGGGRLRFAHRPPPATAHGLEPPALPRPPGGFPPTPDSEARTDFNAISTAWSSPRPFAAYKTKPRSSCSPKATTSAPA